MTFNIKADAQGNKYAPWHLGRIYENGWGVNKNKDTAKQWYEKAAGKGNADAKKKLEKMNKAGCFITTAVCDSLHKPDDCDELTAIRWFRDKIQAVDNNMVTLVREYYRVAPLVVKEIERSDEAGAIYRELWEKSISCIYQNIKLKKYQNATLQYLDMMENLCTRYKITFAPGVEETIRTVRECKNVELECFDFDKANKVNWCY